MKLFSFDNEMRDTTPKYPWRHRRAVWANKTPPWSRGEGLLSHTGGEGSARNQQLVIREKRIQSQRGIFLAIFISFLGIPFSFLPPQTRL